MRGCCAGMCLYVCPLIARPAWVSEGRLSVSAPSVDGRPTAALAGPVCVACMRPDSVTACSAMGVMHEEGYVGCMHTTGSHTARAQQSAGVACRRLNHWQARCSACMGGSVLCSQQPRQHGRTWGCSVRRTTWVKEGFLSVRKGQGVDACFASTRVQCVLVCHAHAHTLHACSPHHAHVCIMRVFMSCSRLKCCCHSVRSWCRLACVHPTTHSHTLTSALPA